MTGLTSLADLVQRIPKPFLYGAAALIQIALLVVMVIDRMQILRNGTEVSLQTRPVDPRDFLRGDYVVLSYNISEVRAGPLSGERVDASNAIVYVKLAPNRDGIHEAVSIHADAVTVTSPEVLIRGHVTSGANCGDRPALKFCPNMRIAYNLEKYFVPEGEGLKLEKLRNERKLTIVAAVLPSGRAAIKRLLVDGQPVYDEPWF